LATGIAIRACQAGHRVEFATAAEWVDRLADHHTSGRLQDELRRLGRYPLLKGLCCVDASHRGGEGGSMRRTRRPGPPVGMPSGSHDVATSPARTFFTAALAVHGGPGGVIADRAPAMANVIETWFLPRCTTPASTRTTELDATTAA